jgi:hypothetical protein
MGNTERFTLFTLITNIYNKETKGPILMELFTATGKLKTFFFDIIAAVKNIDAPMLTHMART